MRNGATVAAFEKAFAQYVGAKYAIALCNGTATLHTALVAMGVKPGERVAVPPLTMSATAMALLQAGAVPEFVDVDAQTWCAPSWLTVSLYGLAVPYGEVNDAAQTLCRHHPNHAFTSYSFQASKILPLGEGGMLVTNDELDAQSAREFSSLGYRMRADQPRIDPEVLKSPTFERHHAMGWNYRMNDLTAQAGLQALEQADARLTERRMAAAMYRAAHDGCAWLTTQHVPEGWTHDYWTYAVALHRGSVWALLANAIVAHGGERPYAAWRLTYQEPAFRHLAPDGTCPIAESLQPRLMQFQTNDLSSAERNAEALRKAIREIGG